MILQHLNAGLIDEFGPLSPVRSGPGSACSRVWTRATWPWNRSHAEPTQRVTHLTYAVRER